MTTLAKIQNIPAYIGDLRSLTGYYLGWIPNEYADQPTADNFYEVLQKDDEIARCNHLLSLMTAGTQIKISSVDKYITEILKRVFLGITDFTHVRKSLVEKAVLFGLGVQRKYYTQKVFRKFGDHIWTVPYRIQEVDRRRMRIERDEHNKNNIYWTIWSPLVDQYVIIEDRNENPVSPIAFQDFCWYIHAQEELSPYFQGFGEVLYALAYIRSKGLQYWADLAESWSKPFMTSYVDAVVGVINASSVGAGYTASSQRVRELLEFMEKTRGRHCAVMDKNDKLEIHEAGSTGNNIIEGLMSYCDRKIQLLLLGAELTTSAAQGGGGSFAQAQVHKNATETIVLYNRKRLAEVIKKQIILDFFVRNKLLLISLGYNLEELIDETEVEINAEGPNQQGKQGQQNQGQPYTDQYAAQGGQPDMAGQGMGLM